MSPPIDDSPEPSSDYSPNEQDAFTALTFDVEEWYHAHALKIPRTEQTLLPSRLDRPLDLILTLLDLHNRHATFFFLGCVAKARPELVHRVAAAGHEIASHGFLHERADRQSIDEFREDISSSKKLLEDITGRRVLGYRAPGYSLTSQSTEHFDTLMETGYAYDSSIYPARSPLGQYGDARAPLTPHRLRNWLIEFPLPAYDIGLYRIPFATGAYLRLAPFAVTNFAIRRQLRNDIPIVLNIHPWELDADQPSPPISWLTQVRHRAGLLGMTKKLSRLVASFPSTSLNEHLESVPMGQLILLERQIDLTDVIYKPPVQPTSIPNPHPSRPVHGAQVG